MMKTPENSNVPASEIGLMAYRLRLRPLPIRIWNAYKFYRKYGGRFWSLRTAIRIAFSIG